MQEETGKVVIGWRELADLPAWDLHGIRAKADTGARSSAIDINHLEELPGDRVRFELVVSRTGDGRTKTIEADVARRGRVRSSLGDDHVRIFVETEIRIAGRAVSTEIGLVSRENMISRMLLGRRCLEEGFLVDSGKRFIHGRRKRLKRRSRPRPE